MPLPLNCPGGEIGRRKGLKIPRRQLHAGSIPAPGTILIFLSPHGLDYIILTELQPQHTLFHDSFLLWDSWTNLV